MTKTFLSLVALFGVVAGSMTTDAAAATNEPCSRIANRLRIGPFFERREMSDGSHFYALRPFYSHSSDPEEREDVTDVAWPLATGHWNQTQFWWRCLLAFGNDLDVSNDASGYQCGLFPFWLNGRSRQGEDYWALFPVYGHVPEFLGLMSDIDFLMFPAYLRYNVVGREREYYLWPVIGREEDEQHVMNTNIFPFYGAKETTLGSSSYLFWPFWTEAVYKEATLNPGDAWMAFPFAGRVDRAREQQWMAVPPFFTWAKTDKRERWHTPWPFVKVDNSETERKRIFWPFYGQALGEDRTYYSGGWFLFTYEDMRLKGQRFERTRLFPFYVHETRFAKDSNGQEIEKDDYLRIWPFLTRQHTPSYSHLRTLELNPIRYAGGIERNWAPFWTFYERSETAEEIEHDALWGILNFRYANGTATSVSPRGIILPVHKPPANSRPITGIEDELEGLLK